MAEQVAVALINTEFKVDVGGTVSATTTVSNRGAVVDQFGLSVEGIDPTWWEVNPPTVSLFPGDEATATILFHPPSGALAGSHPVQIWARSADDPSRATSAAATLTVAMAGGLLLSLDPALVTGRSGTCSVRLTNRANAEVQISLAGHDQEEALEYRFEPAALSVPAFGETQAVLDVRPKSRPLVGKPRDYSFAVHALLEGDEEPAAQSDGEMRYRPLIGGPALPAGKWRWLLALLPLLALALLIRAMQQPEPVPAPTPTAVAATKPTNVAAQPTQGGSGGGAGPAAPPVILSFDLARAQPGFTLSWKVTGATSVELNGEKVEPQGNRPIPEPKDQGFELKATNAGGSVTKRINTLVFPPPVVKSLRAEPPEVYAGQPSVLRWEVLGAERGKMDGKEAILPAGWLEVRPESTRDYVLTAENGVGWIVQRVGVKVLPGSPPPAGPRQYDYSFRDNTDDWELAPATWTRVPWEGGYALKGAGRGFARLTAHSGQVSSFGFRFTLENSATSIVQASFLETLEGPTARYLFRITPQGIEIGKQQGETINAIASKAGAPSANTSHTVKVMIGGGSVDLFLDGAAVIGADDPTPPPGGYVSFEAVGDPAVYIQNVTVQVGAEPEPHPRAPRR